MQYLRKGLMLMGIIALSSILINAVQTSELENFSNADATTITTDNDYNIYAVDIPEDLNFAGEQVPLDDPDVFERMDRELLVNTYWQSNGLLIIKRANKYFPIIEPILEKYGVPDDFKYLAVAESALQNVVSPAGATGFWQIMKTTARESGLEVNSNVDERYHVEKSTEVACKYLLKSKEKFGSWTLAAASYNAGPYGITKQQGRQKVSDYYDLLLGQETGRYIFRILAIKEILSNPAKYGFNFKDKHLYEHIPTYEVAVDSAVTNFADFAKQYSINYKILKIHNPWLREAHLNNKSKKQYQIKIPEEGYYN